MILTIKDYIKVNFLSLFYKESKTHKFIAEYTQDPYYKMQNKNKNEEGEIMKTKENDTMNMELVLE